MAKATQKFTNTTDKKQIIFFEPTTSWYRLSPGESLYHHYESTSASDVNDWSLMTTNIIQGSNGIIQIIIYSYEDKLFHANGEEAALCFDPI